MFYFLVLQFKLGVLNFLGSGSLPDDEILCHVIVATADARYSVTNAAELQLRKIIGYVYQIVVVYFSYILNSSAMTEHSNVSILFSAACVCYC